MGLGRRQMDEAEAEPVRVPPLVQHKPAAGGQGAAPPSTPLHPSPFLPPAHDAVMGLFAQSVPDVASLTTTRARDRDPRGARLLAGAQGVHGLRNSRYAGLAELAATSGAKAHAEAERQQLVRVGQPLDLTAIETQLSNSGVIWATSDR